MDGPSAIGRLVAGGPWVGFMPGPEGYRLAIGLAGEVRTAPPDDDLMLALAIVYFEDALEDPPPSIEATHEDMSELVRSVASRATDAEGRLLLEAAVDSIDDGLAVDEVIGRLVAARRRSAEEQAEPVDLLRERVEALSAGG